MVKFILLSYNYKDKGKQGNKVTVIIDEYRFPLKIGLNTVKDHDGSILESFTVLIQF